MLDEEPGRVGRRLAALPGEGHPVWTYLCGVLLAFAAIAGLSILFGLLVTRVVLHIHGAPHDDEALISFLARHRSVGLTDASLVGSMIAGGVVLPIVAGVALIVAAVARHWRLAGFLLLTLAVESGSYRATTLVIHRHRPEVLRLEKLPVEASYPSGHTAASIAIYGGIALLIASRIENRAGRIAVWTAAALDRGVRGIRADVSRHAPSARRRGRRAGRSRGPVCARPHQPRDAPGREAGGR